jgi:hypothetical protein
VRRRLSKPASFSSALQRLGMAFPPPFVGRANELARLGDALGDTAALVVLGAVGAGKTRLVLELMATADLSGSHIRCWAGDRPEAVRARAERALGAVPGALDRFLRAEPRLLVVDDAHLIAGGAAAAFGDLLRRPGSGRLLLVGREELGLPASGPAPFELALEGLSATAAREMWAHLEETYGPTPAGSCDEALCRTRGLPLALRREYACAAAGKGAWNMERLASDVREALEAVAVLGVPVAPSGVTALVPGIDIEPALIELVSRQLLDPLEDGRFSVHDVVRDQALAGIATERRVALETAAAQLALRGAGDDGALAMFDPIDRLRLAVHHLVAAGDRAAAQATLVERGPHALARAAGGEVLGLIDFLRGEQSVSATPELAALAAVALARRGQVAAALAVGGPADPVDRAELCFRAGDEAAARAALEPLLDGETGDLRARAAVALAHIELARGRAARARALIEDAFAPGLGDAARAQVHLALGLFEAHAGREPSARAALSRAMEPARGDAALTSRIEAVRARCLLAEGRAREAEAVVEQAERAAIDADAGWAADEAAAVRALVQAGRGDLVAASELLLDLAAGRRARGDEVGALAADIEAAAVLERRGELLAAAELAEAAATTAQRLGLASARARAELLGAAVDVAAWRATEARERLARVLGADVPGAAGAIEASVELAARVLERRVTAMLGGRDDGAAPGDEEGQDVRQLLWLAAASGDSRTALKLARSCVAAAERSGNAADMADALAWRARLELASGDRPAAEVAAARAAREAAHAGATWARCQALLVLAALAREGGEVVAASSYARDAVEVATAAGLPVERLVAERALAAIAGAGEGRSGSRAGTEVAGVGASLGEAARDAATRMLADLGLTAVRPYRVISADGQESRVADASPDRLRMTERDLVVDGVREVIVRSGRPVADLRRRSLLKRLLFLFASQPGAIFSKEEIVQKVWSVEYHPLRHDAALFTNIMRIRRLLGRDGAELIRVGEDGYRFTPGKDFLFVEPIAS